MRRTAAIVHARGDDAFDDDAFDDDAVNFALVRLRRFVRSRRGGDTRMRWLLSILFVRPSRRRARRGREPRSPESILQATPRPQQEEEPSHEIPEFALHHLDPLREFFHGCAERDGGVVLRLARSSLRSLLRSSFAAAAADLTLAAAAGAMGSPDAVVSGGGPTDAGSPNPAASRRAAAVCADPRRGSPRAPLCLPGPNATSKNFKAVDTKSAMPRPPTRTASPPARRRPPRPPPRRPPRRPTTSPPALATACDGETRGSAGVCVGAGVARTPRPRTRPTTRGCAPRRRICTPLRV